MSWAWIQASLSGASEPMPGGVNRYVSDSRDPRILDDEVSRYLSMQRAKEVAPVITSLREQAESIRSAVVLQAEKRLAQGVDSRDVIEYATAAVMKKMMHTPSVRLREAGEMSDEELVEAARKLFGLGEDPK